MARTTEQQIETKFKIFIETIGGHVASSYNDIGGYRLDFNEVYGGWNIEQILNDGGGVTHPFGCERQDIDTLWDTLHFATRASEATQGHHGE